VFDNELIKMQRSSLLRFALLFLPVLASSAPRDFNGRWDITVSESDRKRAWWLEVKDAGTPNASGSFVGAPGGQLDKINDLKIEGDELRFTYKRRYRIGVGDQVNPRTGTYKARLVNGKLEGTFELEGEPKAVSWVGVRAPKLTPGNLSEYKEGKPVELFNGKDMAGWKAVVANRPPWNVKNGILVNEPGASDLVTDGKFWDYKLHVEYRIGPKSNSGIGLRARYEVQIFDDFGQAPSLHGNGALYSRILPATNASKRPGEWQTFDITLLGNRVNVVLNGTTIIKDAEIEGLTAIAVDPNEGEPGPIVIQGDHGIVEFRKITLTPLTRK
jgi:hypothetical protein